MAHTPVEFPQKYHIQIGDRGRIVLPSKVRKELDVKPGDRLILTIDKDATIRMTSLRHGLQKLRGIFKSKYPHRSPSRELIAERRREARREERI